MKFQFPAEAFGYELAVLPTHDGEHQRALSQGVV